MEITLNIQGGLSPIISDLNTTVLRSKNVVVESELEVLFQNEVSLSLIFSGNNTIVN